MIIQKFGGTSVADAGRIRAAAGIVCDQLGRQPVVVVSAIAGVTDLLVAAIRAAGAGRMDVLEPTLADLERRHRWALAGLFEDPRRRHDLALVLDERFEELRQLLRAIRVLGEATPRAVDTMLAFGESLSSRLFAAELESRGVGAEWVDPVTVVRTDEQYGNAQPDLDGTTAACREVLLPIVSRGAVPVVGGFVGATRSGTPTTLGRGGSDTTAAVLGACLGTEEIQIWTDVDGILTADPRIVPGASTVPVVSFAEAAELAFYGAKVLHPASIAPAVERDIPVHVRNASRPDRAGTTVLRHAAAREASVASIASRSGLHLLRVFSASMRSDPERLTSILGAARCRGLVPVLASASEFGAALVVSGDRTALLAAAASLEEHGDVECAEGRAVVAVVGERSTQDPAWRAAVLSALAQVAPEAVITGASATGTAVVIREADLEVTVQGLHRRFFGPREG